MQIQVRKANTIKGLLAFIDDWFIFSLSKKMKFAIKVSLSLTLAYMMPLAMGWNQAQTAAITVMLIATSGLVSESIVKGAMRLFGTVIGGVIGLSLIAIFPQDRLVYLVVLSIVVSLIIYLYHAYQGDSTSFMLMGMTVMMVFKGGEVDDAFLYGIDRVYMTVFGIVVYTLVGLFVWPVREEDTTAKNASVLSGLYAEYFSDILDQFKSEPDEGLSYKVHEQEEKLQKIYSPGFQTSNYEKISRCYQELGDLLNILSIQVSQEKKISYAQNIQDYEKTVDDINTFFKASQKVWEGKALNEELKEASIKCSDDVSMLSPLKQAAIHTHVELLKKLYKALNLLLTEQKNLQNSTTVLNGSSKVREHSSFIWTDPEYIKAGLQAFLIFWVSTAIWIFVHPPAGFLLVTLATMLSVFTAFSPLKPSVLTLLFSFGFVFALLSYVFILPNLVYAWELALFIFFYTFIAFYFVNEKISIFFLIGMFTLGIANTMSYNFDLFLMILLIFYLFLMILMLFYYIPFSSKPEHLFLIMHERLFKHAKHLLNKSNQNSVVRAKMQSYHLVHLKQSLSKLHLWADKVDEKYFIKNAQEDLQAYVKACSNYVSILDIFVKQEHKLEKNRLYNKLKNAQERYLLSEVSESFSLNETKKIKQFFDEEDRLVFRIEDKLTHLQDKLEKDVYSDKEVSEVYVNIDLRHSLWMALKKCEATQNKIDIQNLKKNRF